MHFKNFGSEEVIIWSRLSKSELDSLRSEAVRSRRLYQAWVKAARFIFLYIGLPVLIVLGVIAYLESVIGSYYHVGLLGMTITAIIEILLMMAIGYISYRDKNNRTKYSEAIDASRVVVPRSLLHVITCYYRGEYPIVRYPDMNRALEPPNRYFIAAMEWIEKSPKHFDSILQVVSGVAKDIDSSKDRVNYGWPWLDYGLFTKFFNLLLPQMADMSDHIVQGKASASKTSQRIKIGSGLDSIETERTMDKFRREVAEFQLHVDEFIAAQKVA